MKYRELFLLKLMVLSPVLLALTLMASCAYKSDSAKASESKIKSFDGTEIVYGKQGSGKLAVVFIHCWSCNSSFWNNQVGSFSKANQVVWLDLAGHGKSTSKRLDYSMANFGADVAAVVNDIDAHKVLLVGHSMGGPVAIEAAEILGDKVVGIVGVDTFYTPFTYPSEREQIASFVRPFEINFKESSENLVRSMFTPNVNPELVSSVVQQMGGANKTMAVNALYNIFTWSSEKGPSLLSKYEDKLFNINGAPTGEEIKQHKSVNLIDGVGHFVAQAKPAEFNTALMEIITKL